MSQWKIPLFDSDYSSEEINAVVKALQSRWLTLGETTHQFETQFCNFIMEKIMSLVKQYNLLIVEDAAHDAPGAKVNGTSCVAAEDCGCFSFYANNKQGKELVEYDCKKFQDLETIKVPFTNHPGLSSYHIFLIIPSPDLDRDRFMKFLKENGIQSSINYPPAHRFTYHEKYLQSNHSLPVTEDIARREVTLPLYPDLKYEEIDYIADVVRKFVSGSNRDMS
ncbi:MAG: DegT/DnrJ/EryC1/StrS family aminotransferase [bacterium]|nr:MAG: DegT/DnrJ/EryC1/StrS family aminotransferase [bacterium]